MLRGLTAGALKASDLGERTPVTLAQFGGKTWVLSQFQ